MLILTIVCASCNVNTDNMFDEPTMQHVNEIFDSPQTRACDSIANSLEDQGWSSDAAYIIASFETDLLDEADTAEYKLYCKYLSK